jgi:hypothetical protein
MGETALTLRQADEGTIGYVERVLARNGLPERDVRSKPDCFYLLTTSATEFFADRGYVAVGRCDAPDAIRGTTEFEALCPTTATCLRKSL